MKNYAVRKRTLMLHKCLNAGHQRLQETTPDCDCLFYRRPHVDYERIRALAVPKHQEHKFTPSDQHHGATPNRRCKLELVPNVSERIQQLAMPRVRFLTSTKEEFRPVIGEERSKVLNMHIQKSLHTLYSRIANIPVPQKSPDKPQPVINWESHNQWLETRALPKNYYEAIEELQPPLPHAPVNYQRIEHLAQPKYRVDHNRHDDNSFAVKQSALTYKITPNVIKLGAPISRPAETPPTPYERPFPLSRKLNRIKSVGLAKLSAPSKPPRKFYARGDNASVVFTVSKAARKHKASARTKIISKPKVSEEEEPKKDPYKVSEKAIKGKISKKKLKVYKRMSTPKKMITKS